MSLLSTKQLAQILNQDTPNLGQIDLFLSHIDPRLIHANQTDRRSWFESIQQSFSTFLHQSKQLSDGMPGYNQYDITQLIGFITQPSQFSIDLLKEKGKGILYGDAVVRLRQSIFNALPDPIKQRVLIRKLDHLGLIFAIETALGTSVSKYADIGDVSDIGMAHTVYKVVIHHNAYVIKPKDTNHLACFNALAKSVSLPIFATYALKTSQGEWELSAYIKSQTVSHFLIDNTPTEGIITQMAHHAALGDVIGRGDRHLENYILENDTVYAVDLSILFWDNNAVWTQRYAAAGMIEMSILSAFTHSKSEFLHHMDLFYRAYTEMIRRCQQKLDQMVSIIRTFSLDAELQQYRCQFVTHHLQDPAFIDTHFRLYIDAFLTCLSRAPYHQALNTIGDHHFDALTDAPLLKMYYLSHQNRMSSFFLLDCFNRTHLLDQIIAIAKRCGVPFNMSMQSDIVDALEESPLWCNTTIHP